MIEKLTCHFWYFIFEAPYIFLNVYTLKQLLIKKIEV